jgi:glucokinase
MPPRRVIGIDTGGTKLIGGVVDETLAVHHRVRRTWRGADRQETLDLLVQAFEELRDAATKVEAVGFGIPALVEWETGVARWSNHLPLDGVPFRDLMSERLGLRVAVDNDSNLALLAEHRRGVAQGVSHAVMVNLGTGIGSGLLLDGRIYRGAVGFGAELGHVVLDLDGPDCPGACPGRGCFEALVSGRAIGVEGELLARAHRESALGRAVAAEGALSGWRVTELAHDGDEAARRAVTEVGRRLGAGLVGVVNTFNPELIVIGGGAVAAGDLLLDPARAVVAERALPPAREMVRIVPAHFGGESGMLGAALLALDLGADESPDSSATGS